MELVTLSREPDKAVDAFEGAEYRPHAPDEHPVAERVPAESHVPIPNEDPWPLDRRRRKPLPEPSPNPRVAGANCRPVHRDPQFVGQAPSLGIRPGARPHAVAGSKMIPRP